MLKQYDSHVDLVKHIILIYHNLKLMIRLSKARYVSCKEKHGSFGHNPFFFLGQPPFFRSFFGWFCHHKKQLSCKTHSNKKEVTTMASTPPSEARSTRSASTNPPARIIRVNASDRSTVSGALSGAVGGSSPPAIERRK